MSDGVDELLDTLAVLREKAVILGHRADALLLGVLGDLAHALREFREKHIERAKRLIFFTEAAGRVVAKQLASELGGGVDEALDARDLVLAVVLAPVDKIRSDAESDGLDADLGALFADLLRAVGIVLPAALDKFDAVEAFLRGVLDASVDAELLVRHIAAVAVSTYACFHNVLLFPVSGLFSSLFYFIAARFSSTFHKKSPFLRHFYGVLQ